MTKAEIRNGDILRCWTAAGYERVRVLKTDYAPDMPEWLVVEWIDSGGRNAVHAQSVEPLAA